MDAAARSLNLLDLEGIGKGSVDAGANSSPAVAVDLQLIAERADFDALENEWNDLFARAGKPPHVFQSFNFCWHWANHYLTPSPDDATEIKLSIVTGRRNGRLIMLWPLVSQRMRGVRQTFWMGEPVSHYKLDWCDQSDLVQDWVKPLSLAGHLYARVYLGFLRGRVKSALKAKPQPLRRLMRDGYLRTTSAD
jgi:CelD/BcsL family acetyltransferase involved in cellulose biosynthesis